MAVYFMQRDNDTCIKIGYSRGIKQRLQSVQNKIRKQFNDKTITVSLLGWHPGSMQIESNLHNKFKPYRVDGEWFKPDDLLFKYIEMYACPVQPKEFTSHIYQQWADMRELKNENKRLLARLQGLQNENTRLRNLVTEKDKDNKHLSNTLRRYREWHNRSIESDLILKPTVYNHDKAS